MPFQQFQKLKLVLIFGLLFLTFFEGNAQKPMAEKLQNHLNYAEKWHNKSPNKTLNKMQLALQDMQEVDYIFGEWKIQEVIGHLHFQENRLDNAIETYQKTIRLAETMDSIVYKAYAYHNLSEVYIRLGRLKKAEKIQKAAKTIFTKIKLKNWEADAWGNLGNIYTQSSRAKEGLNAYKTAYAIHDSLGNEDRKMDMNFNIGYFYLMQGDGEQAIPYVQKGLQYDLQRGENDAIAMGYGNLAYANSLMGNYTESFKNYQHCIDTSQKYNLVRIEYDTYKDMSETYSKSGNYQKAFEYLQKHYTLKDSIIGVTTQLRINELEVQFATQEKEKENLVLKQEKRLQWLQIWGLILGFILLGTIALLAIQRMYSNIQKKQELIIKNEAIHNLEKQLIENQLHKKKLEQQKTKIELDYKTNRLTDFALDITQKNKISEELNTQLDAIESMKIPKPASDKLRQLRQFIATNLQINEEVSTFQNSIDEAYLEFNRKLKQQFPKLTKNDVILCGFLRLGLQNKEVATLRNTSQNAVKMARYRLRKKLQIDAETDIVGFLKGI